MLLQLHNCCSGHGSGVVCCMFAVCSQMNKRLVQGRVTDIHTYCLVAAGCCRPFATRAIFSLWFDEHFTEHLTLNSCKSMAWDAWCRRRSERRVYIQEDNCHCNCLMFTLSFLIFRISIVLLKKFLPLFPSPFFVICQLIVARLSSQLMLTH